MRKLRFEKTRNRDEGMIKLKEITYTQLKKLRYKQWREQKRWCPILNRAIEFKDTCFDHKHKTKTEKLGEEGKGLLRGVLHFQANSWEGKVTNAFKRYGLHKFNISLPEALRNLANYIENPPMKPEYIHPSERPKAKKLGKRDFNRIRKYYFQIFPGRRKLPEYPKSGKTNEEFERLLKVIDEKYLKK